jgi:antitoxin (DNA-binding transcriptional repressor) of toxin-antitoxin stability system
MEKVVNATEAVRKFSDILDSIRYRGESYTVVRGGKPVPSISPVEAPGKKRLLRELKELVKNMPPLGEEADRFGRDLKEIRKHQPSVPKGNKWA